MAQLYMPEGWHKSSRADIQTISYEKRLEQLKHAKDKGLILEGKITGVEKDGGFVLDLGSGVKGIIPKSEVGASTHEKYQLNNKTIKMQGKMIQFKIKEITEELIIASRKDAESQVRNWMYQNLRKGMVLSGIIRNIEQFGVFVEIGGGVVGLLHIEDISIARIKHPRERFMTGDKIKVIVKSFDKNTGKIILTHKELLGTWEENIEQFKENTDVYGIARNCDKNGIFIELRPNLIGLAEFKSGISYGQKIKVHIKKILPEKKKIKLVILD